MFTCTHWYIGFVASKISDYLTASTGVKVKFEAAIVPNWKDGRITLRNVVMSKRAETPLSEDPSLLLEHKGEDHSGQGHEHDDSHHHTPTHEEIDTNFTMFDVTIDQIDVTLSARRWLDGKGLIEDASIKGVRGVIGMFICLLYNSTPVSCAWTSYQFRVVAHTIFTLTTSL
jgi:distribution and morphology protein 31